MKKVMGLLRAVSGLFAVTMSLCSPQGGASQLRVANGTLFRVEGGLVGSAAGTFHVQTGNGSLVLHYRGPSYREPFLNSGFADPASERIGAIWTVWYHERKIGRQLRLDLDRVVYACRFDAAIR